MKYNVSKSAQSWCWMWILSLRRLQIMGRTVRIPDKHTDKYSICYSSCWLWCFQRVIRRCISMVECLPSIFKSFSSKDISSTVHPHTHGPECVPHRANLVYLCYLWHITRWHHLRKFLGNFRYHLATAQLTNSCIFSRLPFNTHTLLSSAKSQDFR